MSGRAYIVCVDDEQAVLNQLSAQLARGFGATHRVECTESAEEALALIDEIFGAGDDVHLVICDQVMPGLKGDRFLEVVNRAHPEIMKVLLTGQAGLDSAIYAINHAGLHRYVEKPWEPEDLGLTIQSLLQQYALRRELEAERRRLERRSRELRSLHHVGLTLGQTLEPERVLAVVAEAAGAISGAAAGGVVARIGGRDAVQWAGLPADLLAPEVRRAVENALVEHADSGRLEGPDDLPSGMHTIPVAQDKRLYGWLLLAGAEEPSRDTRELLEVLAGQTGARLHSLQLIEERIDSERLSTIGRMISTIVHDFRNPMTAIKGYSGMVEEMALPRERQKEYARLIIEESDRMGQMIDEILEFIRGGRSRLHLAEVSVEELASKLRRLTEPEFQAKDVTFETDLDYAGLVTLDVDRMKRALLNIASNALDAMPAGGTFRFASRRADDCLVLVLSDTGHGISEDLQERIFEPFFTHGKARGIGLGMSITRKIVEEHGGRIRVDSREGEGTRFTLTVPMAPATGPTRGGRTNATRA